MLQWRARIPNARVVLALGMCRVFWPNPRDGDQPSAQPQKESMSEGSMADRRTGMRQRASQAVSVHGRPHGRCERQGLTDIQ